ncbi:hypothetical protein C8R43DRAFT_1140240 [Mycena crocata]|nr:hypothetical protein C8R43DRAFT_1140240 [Mycena crocata]
MSTPVDVPLAADPVEVLRQARFIAKMQMARNIAADVPGVDYRATRDQTVIVPPGVKAHRFSYKDGYRRERLWICSLSPEDKIGGLSDLGFRSSVGGDARDIRLSDAQAWPASPRLRRAVRWIPAGCRFGSRALVFGHQVVSWLGGSAETPHLKIVSDALALEERYPREESGRPVEKIYTLWSDAVCNIAALPPSNDLALLYPGVPE